MATARRLPERLRHRKVLPTLPPVLMAVRLETLGGLTVLVDGTEKSDLLGRSKLCATVICLSVERRVTRERLLDVLWPTGSRSKARHALSDMLGRLPEELRGDWGHSETLVAPSTLTSDAWDLLENGRREHNRGVLERYRGPFLDFVRLARVPATFDRWVDEKADEIQRVVRKARDGLMRELAEGGSWGEARALLETWATEHADDELLQEWVRRADDWPTASTRRQGPSGAPNGGSAPGLGGREGHAEGARASETRAAAGRAAGSPARKGLPGGLVVMPFLDTSPQDEGHAYFCQALAEEVRFALSRFPGLQVSSRTSTNALVREGRPVADIVRGLGVSHALEGSFGIFGETYSGHFRLIEGDREVTVWAEKFEGSRDRVALELRNELAETVARALASELGADTPSDTRGPTEPDASPVLQPGTDDEDAFKLYLEGREALLTRSETGFDAALELLQDAVARDPAFSRAHAGVADVHLVRAGFEYATSPPIGLYDAAREAIDRAMAFDPDLADAHAALGNYLMHREWDWEGAGRAFRRAILLNPWHSPARQWFANYLICLGREREALTVARIALENDPHSLHLKSALARIRQLAGDPQGAAEGFRETTERTERLLQHRIGLAAWVGLALAELRLGRSEHAMRAIEHARRRTPPPEVPLLVAAEAYVSGRSGDRTMAGRAWDRLSSLARRERPYVPPEFLCMAHLGLDRLDEAMDALEEAGRLRSQAMTLLTVEPIFDSLRAAEDNELRRRFEALVTMVGAPAASP